MTKASLSTQRLWEEPSARSGRTAFARDRDRLIHAAAFRRLSQKTQVFMASRGDHFRTRLTHSLEVAQIARALARGLGADEDLTEAISLAHDLGHPPFGHSGEDALAEAMKDYGGFDHNDQTLRIVTRLEDRHPRFYGLNLCVATLDGIIKHNGPKTFIKSAEYSLRQLLDQDSAKIIKECLSEPASLEAQIAALADDIAYNHHDIDDGLRSGLIDEELILAEIPDLIPFFQEARAEADQAVKLSPQRFRTDNSRFRVIQATAIRQSIGAMMESIRQANAHLQGQASGDGAMIIIPPAFETLQASLKRFLFRYLYRAKLVMTEREQGKDILLALFHLFSQSPSKLPDEPHLLWGQAAGDAAKARVIVDYIAGMTDRYALNLADRLLGRRIKDDN